MKETGKQPSLKEKAVHGTQGYPYACYQFDGQEDFPVPLHWHPEAEIIFVEKGEYQVWIQRAVCRGGTGDVLCRARGDPLSGI